MRSPCALSYTPHSVLDDTMTFLNAIESARNHRIIVNIRNIREAGR